MKEKLVIFDWGGIVESHRSDEYNVDRAKVALIKRFNPNIDESTIIQKMQDCYITDMGVHLGATNDISEVQNWVNRLKNEFNFECNFEDFCRAYYEEYEKIYYYEDVVQFIHSLKDKCKIGILSNLCYLDKRRIDMQMNLSKFDYVWLSFELECRKPNDKIYELVEGSLDMSNADILFIDDCSANLEIPKKRGWNTYNGFGYQLDDIKKYVNEFLNS